MTCFVAPHLWSTTGTIFAYGQTGTGKSFTMQGKDDPPELRGIIPSSFNYVFDQIANVESTHQYMVRASYIEIYNGAPVLTTIKDEQFAFGITIQQVRS